MEALLRAIAYELVTRLNRESGGSAALRIRPGATAIIGGRLAHIRLRGGDVSTRGVSARDSGRIDTWLRSAAVQAIMRESVNAAWQRTGREFLGEIVLRAWPPSGFTVTFRL